MPKEYQKLVADVIPSQVTIGGLQRILQKLLGERVSIRDLASILEAISEACGYTHNITQITEHVRSRLARQISHSIASPIPAGKLSHPTTSITLPTFVSMKGVYDQKAVVLCI